MLEACSRYEKLTCFPQFAGEATEAVLDNWWAKMRLGPPTTCDPGSVNPTGTNLRQISGNLLVVFGIILTVDSQSALCMVKRESSLLADLSLACYLQIRRTATSCQVTYLSQSHPYEHMHTLLH